MLPSLLVPESNDYILPTSFESYWSELFLKFTKLLIQICKIFFVTLGLKILKLYRLRVLFEADIIKGWLYKLLSVLFSLNIYYKHHKVTKHFLNLLKKFFWITHLYTIPVCLKWNFGTLIKATDMILHSVPRSPDSPVNGNLPSEFVNRTPVKRTPRCPVNEFCLLRSRYPDTR